MQSIIIVKNQKNITLRGRNTNNIGDNVLFFQFFLFVTRTKTNLTLKLMEIIFGEKFEKICLITNKIATVLSSFYFSSRQNLLRLTPQMIFEKTPNSLRTAFPLLDFMALDGKHINCSHSEDPEIQRFSYCKYKSTNTMLFLILTDLCGKIIEWELVFGGYTDQTAWRNSKMIKKAIIRFENIQRKIRIYVDKGFTEIQSNHNERIEIIRVDRRRENLDFGQTNRGDQSFIDAQNRIPVENIFAGLFGRNKKIGKHHWVSSDYYRHYLECAVYFHNNYHNNFRNPNTT